MSKNNACPLCNFNSYHIKKFLKHIQDVHHAYDLESFYIQTILHGKSPVCKCGCNQKPSFISWKRGFANVIRGHNGYIYQVCSLKEAKKISTKRSKSLQGRVGWSRGLTKENSKIIKKRSKKIATSMQERFQLKKQWSYKLKKQTDSRIATNANVLKDLYANKKLTPWTTGLSKETDLRVKTMADRVAASHQNPQLRAKLDAQKKLSKEQVIKRIEKIATSFNIDYSFKYQGNLIKNIKLTCQTCKNEKLTSIVSLNNRCYYCYPLGSDQQIEIIKYIQHLGFNPISCRKTIAPFEIDILVQEKNIAIEFNGLWWHSEGAGKTKDYHANKTLLCQQKNLQIFHIFYDEWRDKQEIVKSMISYRLGVLPRLAVARKCNIIELNSCEKKSFFNKAHLNGDVNAAQAFGLLHANEIVAAISLRAPFHNKWKDYIEIARFANSIKGFVPGALSKLIKRAKQFAIDKGKKGLLSYVDESHGNGLSYENAGFKLIGFSPPKYWYTDGNRRFNRFKFRAQNNKSEKKVAAESGVYRIWGSRNRIFLLPLVSS